MSPQPRGKLKIYMGYAAGVGKTYKMLEDALELRARGVDVVVGYFEAHGRRYHRQGGGPGDHPTEEDRIPRSGLRGDGYRRYPRQAPQVCAVDEFPHTNVPGSERAKRWEDVLVLLDAGIDVLTTMNIQHLESLNDQVFEFTGIRVRETIPDWVVEQADEVVMVDLPPRALLNRLDRGVVYGREKAQRALAEFLPRIHAGGAARTGAPPDRARGGAHRAINEDASVRKDGGSPGPPKSCDKILVLITPDPETAMLIRRARRVCDFVGAESLAIAVRLRATGTDRPTPIEKPSSGTSTSPAICASKRASSKAIRWRKRWWISRAATR